MICSDNYGFVIFAYKNDAYEAIEHGNDDPTLPRYELCFGGRRAFCKVKYADLGMKIQKHVKILQSTYDCVISITNTNIFLFLQMA